MRDSTILVGLSLASVFVGGYLIFYGQRAAPAGMVDATGQPAAVVAPVPVITLASGELSSVDARVNYLVVAKNQLDALWKNVDASSSEPKIDFNTHEVLAIFAGPEPSTGYAVSVSGVEDQSGVRTVHILLTQPGSGCADVHATVHPFELVAVPKTSVGIALTHTFATTTISCK